MLCDEDSNTEDKHLVILVRLWDDELVRPVTHFLDIPVCITLEQLLSFLNVLMHHLEKGRSLGQML